MNYKHRHPLRLRLSETLRVDLPLVAALFVLVCACSVRAENWPAWRGPRGDSTSRETELPLKWSDTEGIAWKTQLDEWGTSTPAIWDDAVFVTTQRDEELLVLKLDRRTGHVLWTQKVGNSPTAREGAKRDKQKFHRLHNLASPSPVTDGQRVAVHFGNGDLAVYDFDGKQLWKRNLQEDHGAYSIWWGHANSPVLFQDTVVSVCMQDSLADLGREPVPSYLVAHDLQSGEVRWKSARMTGAPSEEADAYTTPVLTEVNGRQELVVMGANQLDGYDPRSGKQLWYLPGLVGGRTVTGPTPADGLLFVTRGMRGPLLAIRPSADGQPPQGELKPTAIDWQLDKGTPDTPCVVVDQGVVFAVTDDGIARALDAATGTLHWTQRLAGDYKASPVAAAGRIYFLNTSGLCTVVASGAKFEKLAENQLADDTLASPAISQGHIFLRGKQALYCLGTPVAIGKRK